MNHCKSHSNWAFLHKQHTEELWRAPNAVDIAPTVTLCKDSPCSGPKLLKPVITAVLQRQHRIEPKNKAQANSVHSKALQQSGKEAVYSRWVQKQQYKSSVTTNQCDTRRTEGKTDSFEWHSSDGYTIA